MLVNGMLASLPCDSDIPSRCGIDAPELARLGAFAVGLRTLNLVQEDQVDVLAFDPMLGTAPRGDRLLSVDLFYPALRVSTGSTPAVYVASFPAEPPAPPISFSVPGIAVRDASAAPADGKGYPLVIVSHGYSNDPAAMTWLTENLASKGYVVAAIRHSDPPITDMTLVAQPLLRRPLDIAFVAAALSKLLRRERLVDSSRLALIGYSMGGYGALTVAGAALDPAGPPARLVPGGLLGPYVRGGASARTMAVKGLRAVVAIAPAGGGPHAAWGAQGLRGITAPLLLISGDSDPTVDYTTGARAMFDQASNAQRYLLTFKGAGHSIGLNPAPAVMRNRLWDQDWFEDPVWRKDRVNAINAHFITAFLDDYAKGDTSRRPYLEVPVTESSAGFWPPATLATAYEAYSSATPPITVWKGFQRNHATGLEFLRAPPHQRDRQQSRRKHEK